MTSCKWKPGPAKTVNGSGVTIWEVDLVTEQIFGRLGSIATWWNMRGEHKGSASPRSCDLAPPEPTWVYDWVYLRLEDDDEGVAAGMQQPVMKSDTANDADRSEVSYEVRRAPGHKPEVVGWRNAEGEWVDE